MEQITTLPDQYPNAVLQTIYQRRAVRKFKDQEVEQALIDQILDAGRMAPSAINKQPWHFYLLQNKATIKALSRSILHSSKMALFKSGLKEAVHAILHPGSFHLKSGMDFFAQPDPVFHGAPVVILITADKGNEWAPFDIGMCAQNMMLAAASLGVQSCPIGLAKFLTQSELYATLKIPDNQELALAIIFGYGEETPEFHPRKKNNVQSIA